MLAHTCPCMTKQKAATNQSTQGRWRIAAIMFLDVKGFGRLSQIQLQMYIERILPDIAKIIQHHRDRFMDLNTWGDAIFAVSEDPVLLAGHALVIRDYFRQTNFEAKGLPNQLQSRISLHTGTVYHGFDSIRSREGVIGADVTLTARIEPITLPGEVWVTRDFAAMLAPHATAEKLEFDDLGGKELAKNYGPRQLLRLRRSSEPPVLSKTAEMALKSEETLGSLRQSYDIIGIGAMNTDFIATASSLRRLNPNLIAEHEQLFEFNKERPATKEEVDKVVHLIGHTILTPSLGGSSFNTIHALASSLSDLKLGFIGVAGASEASSGFIETLKTLGVDTHLIKASDQQSGMCVSYITRGERAMLTWPGANIEMAEHLREMRSQIVDALGRARLVHVTSLFDNESPQLVANILREAKDQNPWLQISFDPGHDWVRQIKSDERSDPIKKIMDMSSYLFLNRTEFEMLGSDVDIRDDYDVANDIFKHLSSQTILILLKKYDEIRVFHRIHKKLKEIQYFNTPYEKSQVEDATGAGDVFAAGLFLAVFVPGLELKDGVELGLRLARRKLLTAGASEYSTFGRTVLEYIDSAYSARGTGSR